MGTILQASHTLSCSDSDTLSIVEQNGWLRSAVKSICCAKASMPPDQTVGKQATSSEESNTNQPGILCWTIWCSNQNNYRHYDNGRETIDQEMEDLQRRYAGQAWRRIMATGGFAPMPSGLLW